MTLKLMRQRLSDYQNKLARYNDEYRNKYEQYEGDYNAYKAKVDAYNAGVDAANNRQSNAIIKKADGSYVDVHWDYSVRDKKGNRDAQMSSTPITGAYEVDQSQWDGYSPPAEGKSSAIIKKDDGSYVRADWQVPQTVASNNPDEAQFDEVGNQIPKSQEIPGQWNYATTGSGKYGPTAYAMLTEPTAAAPVAPAEDEGPKAPTFTETQTKQLLENPQEKQTRALVNMPNSNSPFQSQFKGDNEGVLARALQGTL